VILPREDCIRLQKSLPGCPSLPLYRRLGLGYHIRGGYKTSTNPNRRLVFIPHVRVLEAFQCLSPHGLRTCSILYVGSLLGRTLYANGEHLIALYPQQYGSLSLEFQAMHDPLP
jgi:hypothetical protein